MSDQRYSVMSTLFGLLVSHYPAASFSYLNDWFLFQGKPEQCYRIGCVVSLGTGRVPEAAVESLDLTVPKSFSDFASTFQNKLSLISHLKNLLLDQVCPISQMFIINIATDLNT